MRLLLDTNVFLWWQWQDRRLPADTREAIEDQESEIAVSAIPVWEICIKRQIGKLDFEGSPIRACEEAGFGLLDVTAVHAAFAGDLPRHHGDPFDRMLIARAQVEGFVLVTQDRQLLPYGVPLLGVS